jgi:hypothetical protein
MGKIVIDFLDKITMNNLYGKFHAERVRVLNTYACYFRRLK